MLRRLASVRNLGGGQRQEHEQRQDDPDGSRSRPAGGATCGSGRRGRGVRRPRSCGQRRGHGAERERDHDLLGAVSPSMSATRRPLRMTRMRWARPSTSSISEDTMSTRHPCRGLRGQQVVDRPLGAHVDAAGGLVRDEHRGSASSQRANSTFCWLPPDARAHPGLRPDAAHANGVHHLVTWRAPARGHHAAPARSRAGAAGSTFSRTERPSIRPCSLRDSGIIAMPRAHRIAPGRADACRPPVQRDRAAAAPGRPRRWRAPPPCARTPTRPAMHDDLARAHVEARCPRTRRAA